MKFSSQVQFLNPKAQTHQVLMGHLLQNPDLDTKVSMHKYPSGLLCPRAVTVPIVDTQSDIQSL